MNYIQDIADYFEKVKSTIDKISKEDLNALLNLLNKARDEGRFVFVCGNGGSASTASHMKRYLSVRCAIFSTLAIMSLASVARAIQRM